MDDDAKGDDAVVEADSAELIICVTLRVVAVAVKVVR